MQPLTLWRKKMKHVHKTDSIYFSIAEMGCYNIFYIHDCEIICPSCLKEDVENNAEYTKPIEGSDSVMNQGISRHTNWGAIDLYCNKCNKNLPVEYGDTVEDMLEYIDNIDQTSNEDEVEKANEFIEILKDHGYELD